MFDLNEIELSATGSVKCTQIIREDPPNRRTLESKECLSHSRVWRVGTEGGEGYGDILSAKGNIH